jgi:hypothetical protein
LFKEFCNSGSTFLLFNFSANFLAVNLSIFPLDVVKPFLLWNSSKAFFVSGPNLPSAPALGN